MICEAYGEDAMSQTLVFEWHKKFKGGWRASRKVTRLTSVTKPKDKNASKVKEFSDSDQHVSAIFTTEKLNLHYLMWQCSRG